jgi:hypothetical protein
MASAEFVNCEGLPPGSYLDVETKNRHYIIECLGGSEIRVSGHPEYCPTPVAAHVESGLIELGAHLHLMLEGHRPVTTSRVIKVRVHQAKTPPQVQ